MTLQEMLEIMDARLSFLLSWNPKTQVVRDFIPGAIDRLCQKISNIERIQNERVP